MTDMTLKCGKCEEMIKASPTDVGKTGTCPACGAPVMVDTGRGVLQPPSLPMTACFADQPDFTPFTAVSNNVPLDEMNPEPNKIADLRLRRDALVSAKLPLHAPDLCPENVFNRILWHARKGTRTPYPQWAVCQTEEAEDKD